MDRGCLFVDLVIISPFLLKDFRKSSIRSRVVNGNGNASIVMCKYIDMADSSMPQGFR